MMKVLFLIGALNPGGKEILLLDVLSSKDLPFEAHCIHRKDGSLNDAFYATGRQIHKIDNSCKLSFILKFRKYILSNHIDIVHAQSSFDAMFACLSLFGTSVKIVQTIHGMDFSSNKLNIQRFMTIVCNKTIFVSRYQKKFYIERYNLFNITNRLEFVYNGIDIRKFYVSGVSDIPASSQNSLKIITVGNFVSGHRNILICKFLKLIKEKGIDFDFYFVGAKIDSEIWRYEECVEFCSANSLMGNVHFLGRRNDVPSLLKSMDAFVYSSEEDTFGIAVAEALVAGIPVFVNDWEVMKEITLNGELATLYESGNENDLCNKFCDYFNESDCERKNQLEEITGEVKKRYSIEAHVNGLFKVYKSLA